MAALLPDLAAKIAVWFPELNGRSLAVSEIAITRENMPTLPICILGIVRGDLTHVWQNSNGQLKIADDFVAEFMLETVRHKRLNGSETPFWAFYDYEALRNKFFKHLVRYEGPSGERIEAISMEVESDQYATTISFRLKSHIIWADCDAEDDPLDGHPTSVAFCLTQPKNVYCGPAFDNDIGCVDKCTGEVT